MGTPSIIYRGSFPALIDVVPRSLTKTPEPGVPDEPEMITPAA